MVDDHIKLIANSARIHKYNKGQILFFEGEIPKYFFFLINGKVRIYATNKNHEERTIHIFEQQSFIAEMPTIRMIPYPASAICEEESELVCIEREGFRTRLQNLEFCMSFIDSLLGKIRILEKYTKEMELPLEQRLRDFLQNNKGMLSKMTQRQIAKLLNTTPESISRILRVMKQRGDVEVKRGKIELKTL